MKDIVKDEGLLDEENTEVYFRGNGRTISVIDLEELSKQDMEMEPTPEQIEDENMKSIISLFNQMKYYCEENGLNLCGKMTPFSLYEFVY